jgi:hypothetical protein
MGVENLKLTDEALDGLDALNVDQDLVEMYIQEVDKIPMEDKILAMADEQRETLSPWEIDGIVQEALNKLSDLIPAEEVDAAYDVVYEAVQEAISRS